MAVGILAILDDVALLLDDAAVMGKIAAKKTAGLLGDDLAVNAEKATRFQASRELPAIWAITKGAVLNKIIIIPCAILLNTYFPFMLTPILLLGAAYLSYEGAEHVIHWLQHRNDNKEGERQPAKVSEPEKVKSAIRTDFILSIEIIVITLAAVVGQPIKVQVIVVAGIALLATVGVYSLVAFIVRMDDMGFYLIDRAEQLTGFRQKSTQLLGDGLVALLPKIVKLLSVVGTIAMLLVAGGIVVHSIEVVHHAVEILPSVLADFLVGGVLGTVLYFLKKLIIPVKKVAEAEES